MKADESFKDFVLDQLDGVKNVRARKMFSGFGLYCDKKFFAIISDGVLYFKTNPKTAEEYQKRGMRPFAPSEKQILKNYYEVPPEILENPNELCEWAEGAINI